MPASSLAGTPAPREAASLVGSPRPTPAPRRMPNVVKRANVRMVQAGDRLGLALEPPLQVGIGRDVCGENLDGDGAIQAGIAGLVDFAHSSCTNR